MKEQNKNIVNGLRVECPVLLTCW